MEICRNYGLKNILEFSTKKSLQYHSELGIAVTLEKLGCKLL